MANFYHKGTKLGSRTEDPQRLHALIRSFLETCQNPALLECGEELFQLKPDEYALELRAGRLWIEAWHSNRNLSRRILSIESSGIGTLDCLVHRFGGVPGKLSFLDLAKPHTIHRQRSGARSNFGEQFRRMLYRQFPGWEIERLSSAIDLQRSFSPVFPRAILVKGSSRIAALACPEAAQEHALLTFALIWFDYVKAKGAQRLCLFLPEESGCLTAQRVRWLNARAVDISLFRFNQHGAAGQVDPQDLGNLESRVVPPTDLPPRADATLVDERRLEELVSCEAALIEPAIRPAPIYSQLITFAATDRDIVDLVGVTFNGRPVIFELKADTDIHLPVQALDYWLHIWRHTQRGELTALFPDVPLRQEMPLLRLVAPALSFHSTAATILRYFSPEIDVERVGLNSHWNTKLKVVLRLPKGEAPQSHGGSYERAEFTWNQKSY